MVKTSLYAESEPYERDRLDVGDGNIVYWEQCGNPDSKPAVVMHGGPGSGCSPLFRRFFDPAAYRVVLFDQRGCGRSTPHASAPNADLSSNNTRALIADIERLRLHLGIDRWLVLGGSWGSTLALAYAEANPEHVSEMVLFGVTTGRHVEFDWTFRGGLAAFFPEQWDRLREAFPAAIETATSSTPTNAYCSILIPRCVNAPLSNGACGSRLRRNGRRRRSWRRASRTPLTRWRSRAS